MITSDSRKTDAYREATQQLRNVFDRATLSPCLASRWWLTLGFFAMTAAALSVQDPPLQLILLFLLGNVFALVAAIVGWKKTASKKIERNLQ
jgi:hypothetical protein